MRFEPFYCVDISASLLWAPRTLLNFLIFSCFICSRMRELLNLINRSPNPEGMFTSLWNAHYPVISQLTKRYKSRFGCTHVAPSSHVWNQSTQPLWPNKSSDPLCPSAFCWRTTGWGSSKAADVSTLIFFNHRAYLFVLVQHRIVQWIEVYGPLHAT